jgi:hypothetical protein
MSDAVTGMNSQPVKQYKWSQFISRIEIIHSHIGQFYSLCTRKGQGSISLADFSKIFRGTSYAKEYALLKFNGILKVKSLKWCVREFQWSKI